MKFERWTHSEVYFLIENYDLLTRGELSAKLDKTPSAIKSKARELMLKKSPEAIARISKRPNNGQFQKGGTPVNTLEDGVITVRNDNKGRPISYIRVGLNKWEELLHYNWRMAGNEKPKGFCLAFKDGDTTNCDASNGELITKAENLMRNRQDYLDEKAVKREARRKIKEIEKANRAAGKYLSKAAASLAARNLKKAQREVARIAKVAAYEAAKQARSEQRPALRVQRIKYVVKSNSVEIPAPSPKPKIAPVTVKLRNEAHQQKVALIAEKKRARESERIFQAEQRKIARARKEKKRIDTEREAKNILPTKQHNYNELIQLRIDHRTVIYVKPGADIEKIRAKYIKPKHDPYADLPPVYEF